MTKTSKIVWRAQILHWIAWCIGISNHVITRRGIGPLPSPPESSHVADEISDEELESFWAGQRSSKI